MLSVSGPFADEFYERVWQLERKHRVLCVLSSVAAEGFWKGTIARWERHGRQQPPNHVAHHIAATVRDVVDDIIGQLAKEAKRPLPSDGSDDDSIADDPADESSLSSPAAAQQSTLAEWGHYRLLDDGRILYREQVVARPPYYEGDPMYIRRERKYHGIDDIMLRIRSWNSTRDGLALSQRFASFNLYFELSDSAEADKWLAALRGFQHILPHPHDIAPVLRAVFGDRSWIGETRELRAIGEGAFV